MNQVTALIVDDEPEICLTLQRLLNRHAVQCVLAGNGEEALDLLNTHPVDMVITDVRMPKLDGLDFLKKVRRNNRELPIIIMSGHGEYEVVTEALHAGASNFFNKPLEPRILHHVLLPLINVIQDKKTRAFDYNRLESAVCEVVLENAVELIPGTVNYLSQHLRSTSFAARIHSVEVSLYEILANAMIHGNLEISSAQKMDLEASGTYQRFVKERGVLPPYAERRVRVKMEIGRLQAKFTISDEGRGFDWRTVREDFPLKEIFAENGRGIIMTKMFCDEVIFNESGNQVTLVIKAGSLRI